MQKRIFYGLTFNIVLLAVVSFLTDVSSEMILVLLPFFILTLPGADLFILGMIEGMADSTASFIKILSGHFSDKIGRRKVFVSSGYGFSSFMKVLFPLTRIWQEMMVFRVVERVGKGLRDAPRDAMITESTPKETVGKAFGFHRSMDTSGAILGPILAIILFPLLNEDYRAVFFIAAIPAILSFLAVLFVKERFSKRREKLQLKISLRVLPMQLKLFVLVATTFSLANFSYAFLLVRANEIVGSQVLAIFLYLVFNIVYATLAVQAGVLSDKIGRRPVIISGYLAFMVVCLGYIFASNLFHLVILFVLYGLSFAFVEGTQRALMSDLAPEDLKATALGTFHASVGLGKLPSSSIAGLIWVTIGFQFTFLYGAVLSFLAATMLVLTTLRTAKKTLGFK